MKYHCTVDLLCDWFGLVCFANKNKIVSSQIADSKPVKQELNGSVILPPLVFPGCRVDLLKVENVLKEQVSVIDLNHCTILRTSSST